MVLRAERNGVSNTIPSPALPLKGRVKMELGETQIPHPHPDPPLFKGREQTEIVAL